MMDSTTDSATAEMLLTGFQCKSTDRSLLCRPVVPCAQAQVHYRCPDVHGVALQ